MKREISLIWIILQWHPMPESSITFQRSCQRFQRKTQWQGSKVYRIPFPRGKCNLLLPGNREGLYLWSRREQCHPVGKEPDSSSSHGFLFCTLTLPVPIPLIPPCNIFALPTSETAVFENVFPLIWYHYKAKAFSFKLVLWKPSADTS